VQRVVASGHCGVWSACRCSRRVVATSRRWYGTRRPDDSFPICNREWRSSIATTAWCRCLFAKQYTSLLAISIFLVAALKNARGKVGIGLAQGIEAPQAQLGRVSQPLRVVVGAAQVHVLRLHPTSGHNHAAETCRLAPRTRGTFQRCELAGRVALAWPGFSKKRKTIARRSLATHLLRASCPVNGSGTNERGRPREKKPARVEDER
jgi:hypothetical protein